MNAFIIIKWAVVLAAIISLVYVYRVGSTQSTGDNIGPAILWLIKLVGIIILIILWIIFFRKY